MTETCIWILAGIGGLIVVGGTLAFIGWMWHVFWENRYTRAWEQAQEAERNRLVSEAKWFSEDPTTQLLLERMGQREQWHLEVIREDWRKARRAQAQP